MKCNNIHIIGISEGMKRARIENLFEKVVKENFPNLIREKSTQVQKALRVSIKRNPKRPTARHIIIKVAKFQRKERILNTAREKQEVTYKGALIKPAADYLTETLQARREWQEIFQVMKSKRLQPKLIYTARLANKMEGKISSF